MRQQGEWAQRPHRCGPPSCCGRCLRHMSLPPLPLLLAICQHSCSQQRVDAGSAPKGPFGHEPSARRTLSAHCADARARPRPRRHHDHPGGLDRHTAGGVLQVRGSARGAGGQAGRQAGTTPLPKASREHKQAQSIKHPEGSAAAPGCLGITEATSYRLHTPHLQGPRRGDAAGARAGPPAGLRHPPRPPGDRGAEDPGGAPGLSTSGEVATGWLRSLLGPVAASCVTTRHVICRAFCNPPPTSSPPLPALCPLVAVAAGPPRGHEGGHAQGPLGSHSQHDVRLIRRRQAGCGAGSRAAPGRCVGLWRASAGQGSM